MRIAGQALPRERRIYGHLIVMSIINITIPFLLITWAEQSVDSSLAAILTAPVPLFAIVLSSLFLPDEPMRVNGVVGLAVGFIGVVIITSRGLTAPVGHGELALPGRIAARRATRRRNAGGLPPMIPAVFQVKFAAIITGVIALLFEERMLRQTPRPSSRSCGLGSSVWPAYLLVFRLFACGTRRPGGLPDPRLGHPRVLVLAEPIDAVVIVGTARHRRYRAGQQPAHRRRLLANARRGRRR